MKYAFINQELTEASPKLKAICQCCGKQLIAKCGNINIWHWSHFPERHCDVWWENETEWHRKWKSHFPIHEQEVIQVDDLSGEKHIADVKTSKGLVVELQNSPMKEDELRSRERFYKKMVWIVNGQNFANQFTIFPFKLPPPDSELGNNLYIARLPALINNKSSFADYIDRAGYRYRRPIMTRKSRVAKIDEHVTFFSSFEISKDGAWDSTSEVEAEINNIYAGHHFYNWKNRRDVWYKSQKDVFIDFGTETLCKIFPMHESADYCIQLINKKTLITELGGLCPPELARN